MRYQDQLLPGKDREQSVKINKWYRRIKEATNTLCAGYLDSGRGLALKYI